MYKKIIIILFFIIFSITPFYGYGQDGAGFRFAVMGCMHLGVCGLEEFELAIEKIKEHKPDFVLFLGGMIDSSTEKSIESLWHKFDSIIDKLGVPVYNVSGNCQLGGLFISEGKVDLMEKCFLDRYKKRYYSFEYKDSLFIGLDSDILDQEKGSDFKNQLDFLRNTVSDISKYNNVFIFMHDSLWSKDGSIWVKVIHPLIEGKVKFVFGSARHYLDAKKIGDITYITTGSPPCYLQIYSSKLSCFNFLIVEVGKDNVAIKIVPINPIPIENLGTLMHLERWKAESLHSVVKPLFLTSYEREVFLVPDRVIETLRIKPGMDILDIGAGAGLFTFRFADTLKGTGKVFATEIDPEMVDYIKNKVEEGGYKNIFPVCVKSQGVDPFYKQHSFDIIFFSEAYQYLRHPEDYFRELRPSLKKKGRIYIIQAKNVYDFTEIEIGDFKNLIKILASKEKDFPIFQKLEKDIQYFIKNWQGEDVPPEIRKKITKNLNRMLLDRWLFYDLMDYFANKGITAGEGEWSAPLRFILSHKDQDIRLVKWLFVELDADGVFEKKEKPLTAINKERLCKLNKILLCDILGTHRIVFIQGELVQPIYVKKNSIISTMKKAGYQFVSEYDFLPIHYFLEFKIKF